MKAWIARRYSGYTPDGKFWLTIGFAVLTVDMAIGYMAGSSVGTFWHGVGYAALAAGFAFLPDAAYEEYEHKRWIAAGFMAVLCIPIGVKAYEQQLTYSAGVRHGEMQLTHYVNEKADGAQDDVSRNRSELKTLQAILDKLQADNPWATTTKADGLRAEYKAIQDRMAEEQNGKRGRKAGKGKEFEKLQDQANDIGKRISVIEQADTTQKRIQDLQAAIDKKRDIANKTEHRQSVNVDVAKVTAKLFNVVRGLDAKDAMKTDDVAMEYATMGSASLGSLSLLLLAPISFFLAGRRRIKGVVDTVSASVAGTIGKPIAGGTIVHHTTERVEDTKAQDAIARIAAQVRASTAQYRIAA